MTESDDAILKRVQFVEILGAVAGTPERATPKQLEATFGRMDGKQFARCVKLAGFLSELVAGGDEETRAAANAVLSKKALDLPVDWPEMMSAETIEDFRAALLRQGRAN